MNSPHCADFSSSHVFSDKVSGHSETSTEETLVLGHVTSVANYTHALPHGGRSPQLTLVGTNLIRLLGLYQ